MIREAFSRATQTIIISVLDSTYSFFCPYKRRKVIAQRKRERQPHTTISIQTLRISQNVLSNHKSKVHFDDKSGDFVFATRFFLLPSSHIIYRNLWRKSTNTELNPAQIK